MAERTEEWINKWKDSYGMNFGFACDNCDIFVPIDAGFRADSSLPELNSDFVLCSTECVDKWNAAHGNRKIKVELTERNKKYKINIIKLVPQEGSPWPVKKTVEEDMHYDTGTFGLDRSPPKSPKLAPVIPPEEIKEYDAVIDSVMDGLDGPVKEESPPKPEKPPAALPPPSPTEIAKALKAYKGLLDEKIIPASEYAYITGKLIIDTRDAAAVVAAAAETVETIRTFKNMADDGLITPQQFAQQLQKLIGRPPAPPKKQAKWVLRDGQMVLVRE